MARASKASISSPPRDCSPSAGRVLFAAHRQWPRPIDDDVLSAWLALNCIREWRGDIHWAIQLAEHIEPVNLYGKLLPHHTLDADHLDTLAQRAHRGQACPVCPSYWPTIPHLMSTRTVGGLCR